jgi:hypothetical protein
MSGYTEEELKDMYDDSLDEIGLQGVENYSYLLEEADPIAYNCGFTDYIDIYEECSECGNYFEREELTNGMCEECADEVEEEKKEEDEEGGDDE